jgi:WD40 repeat protein
MGSNRSATAEGEATKDEIMGNKTLRPLLTPFIVVILVAGTTLRLPTAGFSAQDAPLAQITIDGELSNFAWSPDGEILAVPVDNDVRLYTADLEEIDRLEGHTGRVFSVDWSPDGSQLGSGSEDETIRVWDVTTRDTVRVLQGPRDRITQVKWSPDGSKIASVAIDHMIYGSDAVWVFETTWIWEARRGAVSRILPTQVDVWALAWSPDGEQIATSGLFGEEAGYPGYGIKVWDTTTGDQVSVLPFFLESEIYSIAWSPEGSRLAVASEYDAVSLIDVNTNQWLFSFGDIIPDGSELSPMSSVDWSPDSSKIAGGSYDHTIKVWGVATGETLAVYNHGGEVYNIDWSPVGDRIASRGENNTLRIWDASYLPSVSHLPTITPFPTWIPGLEQS